MRPRLPTHMLTLSAEPLRAPMHARMRPQLQTLVRAGMRTYVQSTMRPPPLVNERGAGQALGRLRKRVT